MELTRLTPVAVFLLRHLEKNIIPFNTVSYSRNTRYFYSQFSEKYGQKAIGDVSPEDVNLFWDHLLGRGFSLPYASTIWRSVCAAFNYAFNNRIIPANPFLSARKPPVIRKRNHYHEFTAEELQKCFSAAEAFPIIRNAFYLAMFTGMTKAEILAVTWDCIDLDKGTLLINKHAKPVYESGNTVPKMFPGSSNGCSRMVILSEGAKECLSHQKKLHDAWLQIAGPLWSNPQKLVFTTSKGGLIPATTIAFIIKSIQLESGVNDFNFINLRHHYGIVASRAGIDINTIRISLGQKCPTAALNYWTQAHETNISFNNNGGVSA